MACHAKFSLALIRPLTEPERLPNGTLLVNHQRRLDSLLTCVLTSSPNWCAFSIQDDQSIGIFRWMCGFVCLIIVNRNFVQWMDSTNRWFWVTTYVCIVWSRYTATANIKQANGHHQYNGTITASICCHFRCHGTFSARQTLRMPCTFVSHLFPCQSNGIVVCT